MNRITKILLCGLSLITLTACTSPQSKEHFFDPKTDKASSQSTVEPPTKKVYATPINDLYKDFIQQTSNHIELFQWVEDYISTFDDEKTEEYYKLIEQGTFVITQYGKLKERKSELTDEQLRQVEAKFQEYQTEYQKVIEMFPNHT